MNMENNSPVQRPGVPVAGGASSDSGEFILEGRRVPAGNGVAWLSGGWQMFKEAPGTWIGIAVGFMLIMIVLSLIPLVNLLANLMLPIFAGGIMLGCRDQENGEGIRFSHLFAGFSEYGGQLVLVGVLYLLGMVVIAVIGGILGAAAFGLGAVTGGDHQSANSMMMVLFGLLILGIAIPLAMAVWYAPALVVLHDVPAFQAMKASFLVSVKNFLPFLVYGLIFIVLAIVASIPVFLGWLVLAPVTYGSIYVSYKDMFTAD